ncbi:MAG: hypothetical protein IJB96_10765 [Lachnospira sp.]|nr:hypothetical protein [Lachnospira sp.]
MKTKIYMAPLEGLTGHIYRFSFSRSMSTMGKLAFSLKKMPKVETTVISYNQLLSLGEKTQPEYT